MSRCRPPSLFARIALAAAVASCLPDGARAQQPRTDNPVRSVLKVLGFVPEQNVQTPDFVKRSEPPEQNLDYIPLGSPRPDSGDKPLTRDQILAEEAKLEALRASDERRIGRRPERIAARSAAGPVRPAKEKKAPATCRITCKIDLTKIGQDGSMK